MEYTTIYGLHQWADYVYTEKEDACKYKNYGVQVRTDDFHEIIPHNPS